MRIPIRHSMLLGCMRHGFSRKVGSAGARLVRSARVLQDGVSGVKSTKKWAAVAVIALGILGSSANQLWAAPLGSAQSRMARTIVDAGAVQGDVILVKRGAHRGAHPSMARPHRHHRPRFHRGRQHDGLHWYYWAPWVGAYLYFDGYDSCYRSCRRRGYSPSFCRDRCGG